MAAKEIKFSTDARGRILAGVEILENAVKITYGCAHGCVQRACKNVV